ncbi:MAG: hypothetical protein J2P15_17035, partial [Micromonosporaceae bacterium]|nr:hypothetical protein [Micromonosporaceae bacterium]
VDLRRWLAIAAIATVGIAACYATYLPTNFYVPQKPNLGNRVNVVAALGIVVLVYALLRIAAALVLYALPGGWRPVALATVAAVAVGAGYLPRIEEDHRLWAQAAAEQRAVLATIRRAVPDPRPYDRLFVFGSRAQVASWLPVFFDSWDLWTAVQLTYDNAKLSAYPVFTGAYLYCGDRALWPIRLPTPSPDPWTLPFGVGQSVESAYGHFWFVDVPHAIALRIGDRKTCRAALKTFTPGPYQ